MSRFIFLIRPTDGEIALVIAAVVSLVVLGHLAILANTFIGNVLIRHHSATRNILGNLIVALMPLYAQRLGVQDILQQMRSQRDGPPRPGDLASSSSTSSSASSTRAVATWAFVLFIVVAWFFADDPNAASVTRPAQIQGVARLAQYTWQEVVATTWTGIFCTTIAALVYV